MEDFSNFYNSIQQANEQSKLAKFNYFMNGLVEGCIQDLNNYYISDKERYESYLNNLKKGGFKVLRNSEGKHKVILVDKLAFANSPIAYAANMAMKC